MPGVSTKMICASALVTTPWIDVRVVCGWFATIATFCPTSAFSSVDLPAFGRPTMETNPDLNGLSMRDGFRLAEANLCDAQFVAGQHLHANAVAINRLARLGHAAEPLAHHAAYGCGFDILLAVEAAHQPGH